jgi:DnaJ domain
VWLVVLLLVAMALGACLVYTRARRQSDSPLPFMREPQRDVFRPAAEFGRARAAHRTAAPDASAPRHQDIGVPASRANSSETWDPFKAKGRPRTEQDVTYRARVSVDIGAGPKWDPFNHQESRSQRARAARERVWLSNEPDYYLMLRIEPGATDDQIEQAYRGVVAVNHPDKFFDDPGKREQAERQLKELNAAMQVLRNPSRRALYDAKRRV